MLDPKQKSVLRGMISAVLVSISGFSIAYFYPLPQFMYELGVMRFDILLAICLIGNIGIIANHRFLNPEDIDGAGLTKGTDQIRIYQATLQNTLEQVVLAAITHALWVIYMPKHFYAVVAFSSTFFFIGRICFWRGYKSGAGARSFGFALTFYPSVIMIVLMLLKWVSTR